MRRSGKYYRRNEAEVMRALGLELTKEGCQWKVVMFNEKVWQVLS